VNRSFHVFVPFENVLDRCRFCGNIESSHFSPSPIEAPQPTKITVCTSDAGVVEGVFSSYDLALVWAREHQMGISNLREGVLDSCLRERHRASIEAPRVEGELPPLDVTEAEEKLVRDIIPIERERPMLRILLCRERQLLASQAEVERLRAECRMAGIGDYQANYYLGHLTTTGALRTHIDSLEAEVERLKETIATLRAEIDELKGKK